MSRSEIRSITQATASSILGQAPTAAIPPAIAITLGATAATDAFFLAFAVVSLVLTTVLAAAQHASVPYFVEAHHRREAILPELATAVAVSATVLLVACGAALALAPSASTGLVDAARRDYWLLAPYGLLGALSGLGASALNARRDFSWPALSPAIRSLVVLVAVVTLGDRLGVIGIAAGYVAGETGRLAFIARRVVQSESGPLGFGRVKATGRDFARRAVAQMLGSGAVALIPLIDRLQAAALPAGSVSVLDYAERLWQVPVGVVTSGFMVVSLAEWSHHLSAEQSRAGLSAMMRRSAAALFGLALPATVAVILLRRPIVALLFGHGEFPAGELDRLADTFGMLVACTPIYVAGLAYTRGFLALRRTDWLLGVSLGLVGLKIVLNLILIPVWGLVGIAAATGLAYAASLAALAAGFHLRIMPADRPSSPGSQ